jgi:hypothetical protein
MKLTKIQRDNKKSQTTINNKKKILKINKNIDQRKNSVRKKTKRKTNLHNPVKKKSYKESEQIKWNTIKITENLKSNKVEVKEFNFLPYTQALKIDRRNFISIYISLIKMKIDIIAILFYPEEFTHKSITLSVYVLDFLFSFFMNAFLYSDDIVSEKYHNNGQLNFYTTLFLILTSNIISSIFIYYIKNLVSYRDYLTVFVKEVNRKYSYILTFRKLYKIIIIKVLFFFFLV